MALQSDIHKMRKSLITKAVKKGLYENFGQTEVSKLKEKYKWNDLICGSTTERGQASLIDAFDDWCMNYTGQ